MPNMHFVFNIKKLASPNFPLLTLCFFTSKLWKLFHIVFLHLKPRKASLFLFASNLVLCIEGVEGFFKSSFHNESFFSLPSCLFMCLLHLLTSHVCFACLLHQPHVLALLALCAWLFTSIAYLLFAYFVVSFCCLFVVFLTSHAYLVCLLLLALPTLCACFTCPLCHLLHVLLCHLFPPMSLLSPIIACFRLFHHLLLFASLALFVSWHIHACLCLLRCLLHYLFCHLLPPWLLLQVLHLFFPASLPTCLPCCFLV